MKTQKSQQKLLEEAVSKALKVALLESSDSGVGKFAQKLDEFIESTIKEIDEMVKEGEDLMKDNPTHDYATQERNHLIAARIGILKDLKLRLAQVLETLFRKL